MVLFRLCRGPGPILSGHQQVSEKVLDCHYKERSARRGHPAVLAVVKSKLAVFIPSDQIRDRVAFSWRRNSRGLLGKTKKRLSHDLPEIPQDQLLQESSSAGISDAAIPGRAARESLHAFCTGKKKGPTMPPLVPSGRSVSFLTGSVRWRFHPFHPSGSG